MVLRKIFFLRNNNNRKFMIFVLIALFYFANSVAYGEYLFPSVSFLIIDISEEAENNLEWVEHHISMVDDEYKGGIKTNYPHDGYFQEYTLYNNGDVPYTARLGVIYQYISEMPNSLFRINEIPIQHQLGGFAMQNGVEFPFAFIYVVFPPRERTKIRVNDFSYTTVFRGTPRFTAKIGNYYLDEEHHDFGIEKFWINDIYFRKNDSIHNDSLVAMIAEEGSMSNRLFNIRKTNENTWEIEFTAEFVDRCRNNLFLSIEWGQWGVHLNMDDKGLRFDSEEKLSPYRYIFLTNKQLQVVRNAYYARRGYIFNNHDLQRMYEGFYYSRFGNINYVPNPDFHEGMLTETDRANIEIIRRLEAQDYVFFVNENVNENDLTVNENDQLDSENLFEEATLLAEKDDSKNRSIFIPILIAVGIIVLGVAVFVVKRKRK